MDQQLKYGQFLNPYAKQLDVYDIYGNKRSNYEFDGALDMIVMREALNQITGTTDKEEQLKWKREHSNMHLYDDIRKAVQKRFTEEYNKKELDPIDYIKYDKMKYADNWYNYHYTPKPGSDSYKYFPHKTYDIVNDLETTIEERPIYEIKKKITGKKDTKGRNVYDTEYIDTEKKEQIQRQTKSIKNERIIKPNYDYLYGNSSYGENFYINDLTELFNWPQINKFYKDDNIRIKDLKEGYGKNPLTKNRALRARVLQDYEEDLKFVFDRDEQLKLHNEKQTSNKEYLNYFKTIVDSLSDDQLNDYLRDIKIIKPNQRNYNSNKLKQIKNCLKEVAYNQKKNNNLNLDLFA